MAGRVEGRPTASANPLRPDNTGSDLVGALRCRRIGTGHVAKVQIRCRIQVGSEPAGNQLGGAGKYSWRPVRTRQPVEQPEASDVTRRDQVQRRFRVDDDSDLSIAELGTQVGVGHLDSLRCDTSAEEAGNRYRYQCLALEGNPDLSGSVRSNR